MKYLSIVLAGALFAATPSHSLSFPTSSNKIVEKILGTVKKNIPANGTPKAIKDLLCRKGDARKGIFSLRSFEGRGANVPVLGAFGKTICTGHADFDGSSFDKKYISKHKGKSGPVVLSAQLNDTGITNKGVGKTAKELFCRLGPLVPQTKKIAESVC